MTVSPEHVLAVSIALFAVGLVGAIVRRNLVFILLAIELMLSAGTLALVGLQPVRGSGGEAFAIVVMFVGIVEVVVAFAVFAAWRRNRNTLDIDDVSMLRW